MLLLLHLIHLVQAGLHMPPPWKDRNKGRYRFSCGHVMATSGVVEEHCYLKTQSSKTSNRGAFFFFGALVLPDDGQA
jgi:hypothetical protein